MVGNYEHLLRLKYFFPRLGIQMKLFEIEENPNITTTLSSMAKIYSDFGNKERTLMLYNRIYGRKI